MLLRCLLVPLLLLAMSPLFATQGSPNPAIGSTPTGQRDHAAAGWEAGRGSGSSTYRILEFEFDSILPTQGPPGLSRQYGEVLTGFVSVKRLYGDTVVAAVLTIELTAAGAFVTAPGCTVVSPQLARCELGDLVDSEPVGNTVTVRQIGNSPVTVRGLVQSTTPNTQTGEYFLTLWQGTAAPPELRFSRIDQVDCPLANADVALVQVTGEPAWPSFGVITGRLREGGNAVPFAFDASPVPFSIALVLDDSAALSGVAWDELRFALAEFIQDWAVWGTANSAPFPAIAIYGLASKSRLVEFSTDPSTLVAGLQSLTRRERGSALYETLDQAGTDLASRVGRRIAVVIGTATDSGGAVHREAVNRGMAQRQVSVYGVAVDLVSEPMLRELAVSTGGFRQRVDLDNGLRSSLGRIGRHLRSLRRIEWVSNEAVASYRSLQLQVDSIGSTASAEITDGYAPTGSSCVDACRVIREIPARVAATTPFLVRLRLPGTASQYMTIVEKIGVGYRATEISHGGYHDVQRDTITWSLPPGFDASGVSYLLEGGQNMAGTYNLVGWSSAGGSVASTCQTGSLEFAPQHPAGQ